MPKLRHFVLCDTKNRVNFSRDASGSSLIILQSYIFYCLPAITFLLSGLKMKVTAPPKSITIIETIRTKEEPPACNSTGIKKTPKTAPILPTEAAIPEPNPLSATG